MIELITASQSVACAWIFTKYLKHCYIVQAVCCSDHASCCSNGYTCDVPNKMCNPKLTSMEPVVSAMTELVGNVQCDAQSYCRDGQTCCKLTSGSWGCCPYPQV